MTVVRVSRDSVRAGFAIQQAAHYLRFRRQALQRKLRSRAASWQKAKVQAWININTTITGHTVKLVPYRKEHVPYYHTWMEEYDMQMSWSQDPDNTERTGSHGGGMVGDVNLFITDADEPHTAELEIMIAENNSRRKGIALEALNLFMAYAIQHLGINKFQVKIGDANQSSLQLFGKLGFEQVSHSQVFHEVTLELPVTKSVLDKYQQVASQLEFGAYD